MYESKEEALLSRRAFAARMLWHLVIAFLLVAVVIVIGAVGSLALTMTSPLPAPRPGLVQGIDWLMVPLVAGGQKVAMPDALEWMEQQVAPLRSFNRFRKAFAALRPLVVGVKNR